MEINGQGIDEYFQRSRGLDEFQPEDRPMTVVEIAENSRLGMSSLLRGLKRYCDENPAAEKAKALYESKLAKYKARWQPTVAVDQTDYGF